MRTDNPSIQLRKIADWAKFGLFIELVISERNLTSLSTGLTLYLVSSADKFANSLDPDQVRHFVWPDQDPNCLTLLWYY